MTTASSVACPSTLINRIDRSIARKRKRQEQRMDAIHDVIAAAFEMRDASLLKAEADFSGDPEAMSRAESIHEAAYRKYTAACDKLL
jgi:hypothetical protein